MTPAPTPPDILVVDDTPENIAVLRDILAQDKLVIRAVLNGHAAIKAARSKVPDLILMDILMPGLDGVSACRQLHEDPLTKDVPILIISALDQTQDKLRGFAAGAVDYISKPFRHEEVLARVRTHLSLRNARKQLEAQNEELREAARLRDEMDYILRHDLKGPLNAIIGYAQLLRDPDGAVNCSEFAQYIEDSGDAMLQMIHRAFDLMKMERGTYCLNPEVFDMLHLLESIIHQYTQMARQKSVVLELQTTKPRPASGIPVIGESLLCQTLFHNLLKNAIEAAPTGTSILVRCEATNPVTISIRNAGEVPHEIRDRFFGKYITAGKVGGTGLGSYSAKLMTVAQNGAIRLDSSEKGFTTIAVSLPCADDFLRQGQILTHRHTSMPAQASEPTMPRSLLIADDDAANHQFIRKSLEAQKWHFSFAISGEEALTLLMDKAFDFALIDLEMPLLDGFAVAKRYQASAAARTENKPTTLVAFTAHDGPELRKRCLDHGFAHVITKPITPATLRQEMLFLLGSRPAPQPRSVPADAVSVETELQKLIPGFIRSRLEQHPELDAAIRDSERDRVRKVCHRLKGSCGLYGFPGAADQYAAISAAMEKGDQAAALHISQSLVAFWNHISTANH